MISTETDNLDTLSRMMEEQGTTWGMRKEVCGRVVDALHEFLVALQMLGVTAPLKARLRFDELKVVAALEYQGPAISVPEAPPTAEDLMSGSANVSELSTYMLRQHAEHVRVTDHDGACRVYLEFEH